MKKIEINTLFTELTAEEATAINGGDLIYANAPSWGQLTGRYMPFRPVLIPIIVRGHIVGYR